MTTYLSLRNVQNFNTSTLTASTVIGSTINFTSNVLTLGPSAGATQSATLSNGTWSTWTATKTSMSNVKKIAVSSTGQYQLLLLTVAGTSALWLSSDSGATWSLCTAYGLPSGAAYSYTSAAISADGRYITIGVYGDLLYVSSDSGATFNNPQPGTAPFAWLRFENNTTDTMGNSTITPTTGGDAPTFSSTVVPNAGQAYSMRLTNTAGGNALQYVRGTWAGSPNFTVSFWMNPQHLNSTYQHVFYTYAGAFKVTIADNNTLYVAIPSGGGTGTVNIGFTSALTTNTWYYVTVIFQTNGLCSFYVNNTLIASVINSGGVGSYTSSVFSLGTDNDTTYAYNGFIDDFRLTNSAITYQPVPLSPYAWLKFENAVTDTMGASSPAATVTSGTLSYVPGVVGRSAIYLANTAGGTASQYVRGTWSGSANFTVSFWMNPQTVNGTQQACFISYSGYLFVGINTSNRIMFYIPSNGGGVEAVSTPYTIAVNTWYYVTAIFQSNSTCSLYVNNALISTYLNVGGTSPFTATAFGIGTYDNSTISAFNGYIDDLRIYNFALTPPNASTAQIMTLPSNWSQIALSGSGQYQLAGTDYGQVYKSTDYGATWTASTGANQAGSTGCVRNLALSHSGQYQLVNAQKWVTPNTISAGATWYRAGSTWTASASSTSAGYSVYGIFDTVIDASYQASMWNSGATYNLSGAYTGAVSTTVLGGVGAVTGEYFQLQSSVPLVLSSYSIRTGGFRQSMKTGIIVGSTDGINWYPLQSITYAANPFTVDYTGTIGNITLNYTGTQTVTANNTVNATTTAYPTSATAYTYFRFIAQTIFSGASASDAWSVNEFVPNFLAANTYTPQNTNMMQGSPWQVNGVAYRATASSSTSPFLPEGAFTDPVVTNVLWRTSSATYTGSAYSAGNTYLTTIQTIGSIGGEWLQLQSSVPFILSSYALRISAGASAPGRSPKTYYLVGSNDGNTWYPLQYCNFTTNPFASQYAATTPIVVNYSGTQSVYGNQAGSATTTAYSYSTTAYSYFRIVVTNIYTPETQLELGGWFITFLGGQSYSTNYGSTWTTVPTTFLAGPTAVSGNGQYQIGVNNTPLIARLTLDNTAADSMGGLTQVTGATAAGAVTYSTSIKQVGTHSAFFPNTAGATSNLTYLNYALPPYFYQPPSMSLTYWFYMTALGATGNVIPVGLNNNVDAWGPIIYILPSGVLQVYWMTTGSPNGNTFVSSSTPSINTWYHVAMTYAGGVLNIYLNGNLIGTINTSGNLCLYGGGNITNLYVGAGRPNTNAFAGYVDDVRLYTSALTAAQVAALYADATTTVQSLAVTSNYLAGLSSNPSNPVTLSNAAAIIDTATSYTGQYMIAVTAATSGSNVYYSTNYGSSWTGLSVGLATAPLVSCAMSYDGTYATVASTTTVYTLNNNTTGFTVAVGAQAGQTNQASQAIAIGNKAGQTNQAASSIVLNATGSTLTACGPGFYVGPVQAASAATTTAGYVNLLGYGQDSQVVQNSSASINPASGGLRVITGTAPNTSVSLLTDNALTLDRSDGGWNPGDLGAMLMFRQLWFSGYTGASNVIGTGGISGFKSYGNGNFGGGLAFHYQPAGANNLVQGMCLNHSGYLGIGTNAPGNTFTVVGTGGASQYTPLRLINSSATSFSWEVGPNVSGDLVIFYNNKGAWLNRTAPENGWNLQSDARLKEQIEPLTNTLSTINSLNPVCYRWKSKPDSVYKSMGLIAQEVKDVLPQLVDSIYDSEHGEVYGLSYTAFIPMLIGSVKELSVQNADHTATLAALQSTITALQAQVSTLVSSSAPAPSTSSDSTTASSSSSSDSTTTSSTSSDSTTAPSTSSDSTTASSDSTTTSSSSSDSTTASSDSTTTSSDSTTTSSTQSV